MAVLQMLSEVIRTVKLFAGITFAEFMHLLQVSQPLVPVKFRWVPRPPDATGASEFLPTVAARVSFAWSARAIMKSPIIA